ncbi:transcriptional regulator with XRE-family HTH domain [Advenella incenata]|uniref:Transcriptional regulator with XRE-family HTH domain n=1 Tax=Advenella incenata TaxID=267800 RepID=A0A4Q7V781_9BURK|nr:helix-turn-helix domain-containing protein [Advenella incenata]RZT91163.1 transcriptional regulator with XRE-family HTH domain [Advenella incenata]
MQNLSERLRYAMQHADISQSDLARKTGAKRSSVSNWASGKTKNLKGKNLVLAAELLCVKSEWLATGQGPMKDSWPFVDFSIAELKQLPETAIEEISEYIVMKIEKQKKLAVLS